LFCKAKILRATVQNRLLNTSIHGKFHSKSLIRSKFLEPPCDP
jgi:hypothetical protein